MSENIPKRENSQCRLNYTKIIGLHYDQIHITAKYGGHHQYIRQKQRWKTL